MTDEQLTAIFIFGLIGLGIAYGLIGWIVQKINKTEHKTIFVEAKEFNDLGRKALNYQKMLSFIAETETIEFIKEDNNEQNNN